MYVTLIIRFIILDDSKKSHPVLLGHFINDGENCIWTGLVFFIFILFY